MTLQLDHGDWVVSDHAQDQMRERQIDLADLDAALYSPSRTWPSPKPEDGPNIVYYAGAGALAVVNEIDRVVITVGYAEGAQDAAVVPRREEAAPAAPRRTIRRERVPVAPVEHTRVPDGVMDEVRALIGPHQKLKMISATEFLIVNA